MDQQQQQHQLESQSISSTGDTKIDSNYIVSAEKVEKDKLLESLESTLVVSAFSDKPEQLSNQNDTINQESRELKDASEYLSRLDTPPPRDELAGFRFGNEDVDNEIPSGIIEPISQKTPKTEALRKSYEAHIDFSPNASTLRPETPSILQLKGQEITREEMIEELLQRLVTIERDRQLHELYDLKLSHVESLQKETKQSEIGRMAVNTEEMFQRYKSTLFSTMGKIKAVEEYELNMSERKVVLEQRLAEEKSIAGQQITRFLQQRSKIILRSKVSKRIGMSQEELSRLEARLSAKDATALSLLKETKILQLHYQNTQKAMKQREIAEGLHLIDFEQLKIENASLTEKIKDRQREVEKMKSKLTTMAHSYAHHWEKYGHVVEEVSSLKSAVDLISNQLDAITTEVPLLKKQRENLRKENTALKEKSGFLVHRDLLEDYQKKSTFLEEIQQEVETLRSKVESLNLPKTKLQLKAISSLSVEPKSREDSVETIILINRK